jgi:glutamyl/glutaminyl-tRNA synthetase
VGHARTFWTVFQRAREAGGTLVMRMEDLDPDRCRSIYAEAALDDLRWLGIRWQEGPGQRRPVRSLCAKQAPSLLPRRLAQAAAHRPPVSLPLFAQGLGRRTRRAA